MLIDKKVVAVANPLQGQGRALVEAMVKDGEFQPRAIVRIGSAIDEVLRLKGIKVQVVEADYNNADSFALALKGSYGFYGFTCYWTNCSLEQEYSEARCMADAARLAGVKHIVWTTMEDSRKFMSLDDQRMPTLLGKYKSPLHDIKGECDAYFADLPTTFQLNSFYWDCFIYWGFGPRKDEQGNLYLNLPMGDKLLPGVASEDVGKLALGIFKRPEYIGKRIGAIGEALTLQQIARKMSKALDREIVYKPLSFDAYRKSSCCDAAMVGNMLQVLHDFNDELLTARNVDVCLKLNPELMDFDAYLAKYKNMMKL